MKFRINLEKNQEKINEAIYNAYQMVQTCQSDNWHALESKTRQKRAASLYKKLSSSSNSEIAQFVHQPLEPFCQSITNEFNIHLLVLLSRITQVI